PVMMPLRWLAKCCNRNTLFIQWPCNGCWKGDWPYMKTVPIWIITSCRQAVACWIKAALLLAGLSGMSCTAFADNNALLPQTYELHYQSKVRGFTVKAIQSLSVENGTYRLQQQTRAAILSIDETSLFRF